MIKDISGNKRVKESLLSLAVETREGVSYIFAGERNTGKNFAARQFAKAINCLNPEPDNDSCGECKSCLAIEKTLGDLKPGNFQIHPHPDIKYINNMPAKILKNEDKIPEEAYKAILGIGDVVEKLKEANAYKPVILKSRSDSLTNHAKR